MPLLNFPSNPNNGDKYDVYYYDATSQTWKMSASPSALESRIQSLESDKINLSGSNVITGNKTFSAANTISGQNIFNETQNFDRTINYGASTIGQVITYSKAMAVTTSAQNVFTGADNILPYTGTYLVKIENVTNWQIGGGIYEETFSGVMQWYTGGTNNDAADGIGLTYMGHADNGQALYLRTYRIPSSSTGGAFQIWSNSNYGSMTYNFSFRRIG